MKTENFKIMQMKFDGYLFAGIFIFFLIISLIFVISRAEAFPELAMKHGYPSCGSCHVSNSGGGALTPYGRGLSEEILSTWHYEGEGNVGHYNYEQLQWLAIGGDARYVNVKSGNKYSFIQMQRDIEIAVGARGFWIGGSYGKYNLEKNESRKHYLIFNPNENMSFKLGKFQPAYGINFPDHTIFSRGKLGMGQGFESYNAELSFRNDYGEMFCTGLIDDEGKHDNGILSKLTGFFTKNFQAGISYMFLAKGIEENSVRYGGFSQFAYDKWLYLATDINEELHQGSKPKLFTYSKISLEVYKGINAYYENNYAKNGLQSERSNGLGFDFFPRPHIELMSKASRAGNQNQFLFLTHYFF